MCPHTAIYVSSHYYRSPQTTICVLILLYMCPHTTTYALTVLCMCAGPELDWRVVSAASYYYMCPHCTLYVCRGRARPASPLCCLILQYMYSVCVQEPSSTGESSLQPHSRILQLNRVEQDFGEVLNLLAFCWHKSTNTGTKVQKLTQKALLAAGLD